MPERILNNETVISPETVNLYKGIAEWLKIFKNEWKCYHEYISMQTANHSYPN